MKKTIGILTALIIALVIALPLPVFAAGYEVDGAAVAAAADDETPPEGEDNQSGQNEENPPAPGDGEGTDGETEPVDNPLAQGELGEDEYYYITAEELEAYRNQYAVISPGDLLLTNLTEAGTAFGSLFLPILSPLMWFVPFGPIVAGAMIFAPVQGFANFFDTLSGSIYYIFHAKEIKDSFSVDNLYASPVYEYVEDDEGNGETVCRGYEIRYTAYPDEELSYGCRRVRVAE